MFQALENRLLYHPTRFPDGNWDPPGLEKEDVYFTTADGVKLHGWHIPKPAAPVRRLSPLADGVLFYCHGNAGNLAWRAESIKAWQREIGLEVFIFDYRGYGHSQGRPFEQGLYLDAEAAYHFLAGQRGIAPDRLVFLGRSLGGAVAMELALRAPPRALLLESAFTSFPDIAKFHHPWLPFSSRLKTRFPTLERIRRYHGSVLITHGDADAIVPFAHGRQLFAAANEPKRFLAIRGAGHNDVPAVGGPLYWSAVAEFLEEVPFK